MKVGKYVVQENQIFENSLITFGATYGGKRIYITAKHDFGRPKFPQVYERFLITIINAKTLMHEVQTYKDYMHIDEAIIYAIYKINGVEIIDNSY